MADTATAEIGGAIVTLDLTDVAHLKLSAAQYSKAAASFEAATTGHERLLCQQDMRAACAALVVFALQIANMLEP